MEHLGTQVLETERLILRPFRVSDAADMYRNWAGDPEVTRYLTWNAYDDPSVAVRYLTAIQGEYDDPSRYNWAIELKEIGQVIGGIDVVGIRQDTATATIGYVLGRPWWGQGLMPEAYRAVRDFLFDQVGFQRLAAAHDTDNPKSGRVMAKIGMTRVGVFRKGGTNRRGVVDLVMYDLLKDDPRL